MSSVDRQTEPLQPERSLSDLFSTMSEDLSTLVRKELELAREEVKVEASRVGNVAKFFSAAGVVGYFAVMMLLFAAAWGLAAVMPDGLAFLIVGVVLAAVAAVLAVRGRAQVQAAEPEAGTDNRNPQGGRTMVERTTELRRGDRGHPGAPR